MRLPLIIAGGAVGVVALWTAGWFAGRAFYVEPEADKAVAALREGSLFFNYRQREIGGFPFGYDVAYEDVSLTSASGLWTWAAPTLRIRSGVADAGVLEMHPAGTGKLSFAPAVIGGPADEPPIVFDITANAFFATIDETGETRRFSIRADTLNAVQAPGEGMVSGGRLDFEGLAIDLSGAKAAGEAAFQAKRMTAGYSFSIDMVSETKAEIEAEDVAFKVSGDGLDVESFDELLAGEGVVNGTLETKRYRVATKNSGGPSAPPSDVSIETGSSRLAVDLEGGRARYEAGARDVRFAMAREGEPGGGAEIGLFETTMEVPIRKGAGLYQLGFTTDGLELDETLWRMFDPAGALERTPLSMALDLGGEADMLNNFSEPEEAVEVYGPPIELRTMEIRAMRFDGMGLQVEATGAFDLLPGMPMGRNVAQGGLTVDVKGAIGLLDRLASGGLIPREATQTYTELLTTYGRAGEESDHYMADIRIADDEMTVNGRPLAP